MKQINEIQERLDRATPGPWHHGIYESVSTQTGFKLCNVQGEDNADFIAHAPTDMAHLLTLVEEKDKQIEERDKRIAELEARIAELENPTEKLLNPAGEYAMKFAENHGISFHEAMEQPMVKARFDYYFQTGM